MEQNGYVLSICTLFGFFCVYTLFSVFSFLMITKDWYKIKFVENLFSCLYFILPFVAWGLILLFLEVLDAPINMIPFWVQIVIIVVLIVIDFFECGVIGNTMNNLPEEKKGSIGARNAGEGD